MSLRCHAQTRNTGYSSRLQQASYRTKTCGRSASIASAYMALGSVPVSENITTTTEAVHSGVSLLDISTSDAGDVS
jgi:hypothetical protein